MKALIIGINGQDGFYLRNIIEKNGGSVVGVSRSEGEHIRGDVTDYNFISQLVKVEQPDYIINLAANSTTNHGAIFENHQTISTGTLNVLEAVYRLSPHSKVFISGSGLQFVNKGLPINEKDDFDARDAYSLARIHSVYAARYYRRLGIKTYVGYFFNHDSPLRTERHVNQKIIVAAKNIAEGKSNKLTLGNIGVKKEFTFAGDVAEAIWKFVGNDNVFETVIGSGKAYAISDWLDICFSYYNLDWKKYVSVSNDFIPDYDILVSNPETIFSLGWKPAVEIGDLAIMMLENPPATKI